MISALADRLGLGPVAAGEDGVSIFSFEEVDVLVAADEEAITLFARLGEAPSQEDAGFAESLLSANLFWRDTDGATLSLEPFSRIVILARRLPVTALASEQALEAALERFAQSAIDWTRTVDRLRRGGADGVSAQPPHPPSIDRA